MPTRKLCTECDFKCPVILEGIILCCIKCPKCFDYCKEYCIDVENIGTT